MEVCPVRVGPGEEPPYLRVLATRPLTDLFHDAGSRALIDSPMPQAERLQDFHDHDLGLVLKV
ncbi:hypothetical protein ACPXB1_30320 [Micromonospora sp. DT68]|uniref:hypothetical protein n=1 Tax=Micromonospora TaxID=1873 RepID=UPI0033A01B9B